MSSVAEKLYEATKILGEVEKIKSKFVVWEIEDDERREKMAQDEQQEVVKQWLGAIGFLAHMLAVNVDTVKIKASKKENFEFVRLPMGLESKEQQGTKDFLTYSDGSMLVIRYSGLVPVEFTAYKK